MTDRRYDGLRTMGSERGLAHLRDVHGWEVTSSNVATMARRHTREHDDARRMGGDKTLHGHKSNLISATEWWN